MAHSMISNQKGAHPRRGVFRLGGEIDIKMMEGHVKRGRRRNPGRSWRGDKMHVVQEKVAVGRRESGGTDKEKMVGEKKD